MANTINQKDLEGQSILLKTKPRLEHIALNVSDPISIAKWYCEHLGMRMIRKSLPPTNAHFISDSASKIMFELYNNAIAPVLDFASLNPLCLHLAFISDDLEAIRNSLVTIGAKVVDDITTIPNGDQILMMRDPWGLSIQFVKRFTSMLKPMSMRPEHFGFNVLDPERMTKWYCDNLEMKVMRKGTPPTYTNFFSDAGSNMMLEVYNNSAAPALDMASINLLSLHIAFITDDIKTVRNVLLNAEATLLEEIKTLDNGDLIMILRDPWSVPIQFLKRAESMLK